MRRSSGVGYGRRVFTDLLTLAARYGNSDLSIQVAKSLSASSELSFVQTLQLMRDEGVRPNTNAYALLTRAFAVRGEVAQVAEVCH
jgi:hypothetical protein